MAMHPGRPISPRPEFDDAKLVLMQEPLSIRVERVKEGRRFPIPLWEGVAGLANGQGWTKDEVRDIERRLVEWSGGGFYRIQLTDATADAPQKMIWEINYPTSQYPELVPPPLADSAQPDAAAGAPPQPPPQGNVRMPPYTPFQPPGYQLPHPPPYGSAQYPHWRDDQDRREQQNEMRRLREENERRDREAREAAHKAELERERSANNERFARLENMFSQLSATLKDNAAPRGPSPEMLAMQQQLEAQKEASRRAEERADEARREQEANRRETLLRDMIKQQSDDTKQMIAAMQRQIDTMAQQFQTTIANLTAQIANNANRQDPLIPIMLENARQHAEVIKEMAREGRQTVEKLQASVMNPRELMEIARENAASTDRAVERTTRLTDHVIAMQGKVLETAIAVQPNGGTSVLDVVDKGIEGVKTTLERLVGGKSREAIAQAQANAEIAKAQVQAMEIQARAQNPGAFPAQLPPAQPSVGLSGPAEQSQAEPAPQQPPTHPNPAIVDPERLWGRRDSEWFGPVLPDVMRLRLEVNKFIEASQAALASGKLPKSLDELPGAQPMLVAGVISQAVIQAQQAQASIPALADLLLQGHLEQFMTLLLPDAPADYKADVIRILQAAPEQDDDDDDDPDGKQEDDKGDDQDNAPQPAAAPAPAPAAPQRGRNGARTRA